MFLRLTYRSLFCIIILGACGRSACFDSRCVRKDRDSEVKRPGQTYARRCGFFYLKGFDEKQDESRGNTVSQRAFPRLETECNDGLHAAWGTHPVLRIR